MTNATSTHSSYIVAAVADGYFFECTCGELYKTVESAAHCRKCRTYSIWGYCKYVTEILSGVVVHGELPTPEEEKAQEEIAVARWEEERAEYEFQTQMWAQQGELYEAEMQRQREEAERAAADLLEDQLYMIQDSLMKVA